MGPLPRRRLPGPPSLHPLYMLPGGVAHLLGPTMVSALFLPAGRSNFAGWVVRATCARITTRFQKRPSRLNRSHAPHLSLRRRLVGPLASSWNPLQHGRSPVAPSSLAKSVKITARQNRYLQHSPAPARQPSPAALNRATPSPRRSNDINSPHLFTFHLLRRIETHHDCPKHRRHSRDPASPTAPTPTTPSCSTASPPISVRVRGYKFTHTLTDIETLNHRAINEAFYDVTAISFHAYPYLQGQLHPHGTCRLAASARSYGPMIVSSRKLTLPQVKKTRIAVPGTPHHRLPHPQATLPPTSKTAVVPFDKIIPAVAIRRSSTPASSSTKANSPTPTTA